MEAWEDTLLVVAEREGLGLRSLRDVLLLFRESGRDLVCSGLLDGRTDAARYLDLIRSDDTWLVLLVTREEEELILLEEACEVLGLDSLLLCRGRLQLRESMLERLGGKFNAAMVRVTTITAKKTRWGQLSVPTPSP